VQAVSSMVTTMLTFFLILITIIYVRANVRSTKAIETDLKFRTKPLPALTLNRVDSVSGFLKYKVEVTTEHAPLRFRSIVLKFRQKDGHVHENHLQVANFVLRITETYSLVQEFCPGAPVESWSANLAYADMANLRWYEAFYDDSETQLNFEVDVPARTLPGPLKRRILVLLNDVSARSMMLWKKIGRR
jgi:hypothetical protein